MTSEGTKRFMREFETWVLTDFTRADRSIEAYNLDPEELVEVLWPWTELAVEIIGRRLHQLDPADAHTLRSLFSHALDRIEHHYAQRGDRFCDALIELHPLDDLLAGLGMAEAGLLSASHSTHKELLPV